MATAIRPRAVPQCSACLQRFAWAGSAETNAVGGMTHQQVRWKRRMPNNSATVTVRLRKDMPTYGKKGAVVPVVTGQMRNIWFPRGIADYVTRPDLKVLRLSDVPMERDYSFMAKVEEVEDGIGPQMMDWVKAQQKSLSDSPQMRDASMFQKSTADLEELSAERIAGLLDIFVPAKIEFFRQPIVDTAKDEQDPEKQLRKIRGASGAANDLLAARLNAPRPPKGPTSIYGSVSVQDVLTAVKTAMAENDEARRVVINGEHIQFVDLPTLEGTTAERVKHTGEFIVEIKPPGVEQALRRTVRVIAQDA